MDKILLFNWRKVKNNLLNLLYLQYPLGKFQDNWS